jgi:chemotaxis regulatin CheY-phosphate phosphatase CheZ
MVDVRKVTPEQDYIIARHSRMVGKILDLIEAFTPEGSQLEKQKKLIQIPLYDFRKEMIFLDSNGVPDTSENT